MITLEMCLDYIKHPKRKPYMFKEIKYPVELTETQKKFLGNLCEGKLTSTPRIFGKTFIIKLYCECLDYYTDMAQYETNIKYDDYISLEETINSYMEKFHFHPYDTKLLVETYDVHKEKALREYNSTSEYMEKLKQEIKTQQND